MKRIVYIIIPILIIILGIGLSQFLASLKTEPQLKKPPIAKRYVKADKVSYSAVKSGVFGSGRLASTQQVDIISEVQGQILQGDIAFKKGQSFRKGDVLVRIFSEEAELNLKASKSGFLNSLANILPDLKVDYSESFSTWSKFFDQIIIDKPLPELPVIKTKKEKIFLSSRNILNTYYSIKTQEVRLAKYEITAPFSGSISTVALEVGSVANPGSRLAKIIKTGKLELEVPIEVANAKWIKTGQQVNVTDEAKQHTWIGKVVRKTDFVDVATQSISVFVELHSTPENPLYEGQYLKANFDGEAIENSMEIPRNAVFNFNEVFIVENDSLLEKREIEIVKINEKTLLFKGLKAGTMLVTEPLINASEKMKVQILE